MNKLGAERTLERLEGMQGPEQGLVGDVAKRIPRQGHAEEAKPGERGVGEIAIAPELRGHVERKRDEARRLCAHHQRETHLVLVTYYEGKATALDQLLEDFDRMAGERSDLSNVQGDGSPDTNTQPTR